MRKFGTLGNMRLLALSLLCAAAATAADARELIVQAARVSAGPLQVAAVKLTLDWPDRTDAPQLEIEAGSLAAPALGYRFERLRWRCPLQRVDGGWRCDGELRAAKLPPARFALRIDAAGPQLELRHGKARLQISQQADGWPIAARTMPADWLLPLLAQAWPALSALGGPLDGRLRFVPLDDGWTVDGRLASTGLGLDNADGTIATAGLGFDGTLQLASRGEQVSVAAALNLTGGEWLLGPLYSALPATPVQLELAATVDEARWRIERLHWSDPGVLQLDASARLQPDATPMLKALDLSLQSDDLALAHARYFDALLGSLGAGGLQPSGRLAAQVRQPAPQQWTLDATLQNVAIDDARGRFALAGAAGELRWTAAAEPLASRLQWQAASVHGIALGPAEAGFVSSDGWLRLDTPLQLAVLGGRLTLPRLGWRPPLGERSLELDLGLELQQLEMARLAARFGWPAFSGELSGRVPAARYENGVFAFDGGLRIALFDGTVDVQALRMERPFGVAPRLEADIGIERLDLQPLTAAFGFGEITGRLDGRIGGLRLIDWSPVAFDASLQSSPRGKDRRRISARAVDDLTRIGGGGVVAGLQKQMLKLFDSFAYSRIGLACTLRNEVCRMGGIEPANGGYLIVDGAGLPHITVIGHQQQVDWPVLINRLRAATEGGKIRLE